MKKFLHLAACTLLSFSTSTLANNGFYLEFIGEDTLPTGFMFADTEVGGLSGIDFDAKKGTYLAISDDRAQLNPARFYELNIDLSDGHLDSGDVQFIKTTEILDKNDVRFAPASLDPESIRLSKFPDLLYWTSEGDANAGIGPFVRIMNRAGQFVDEFSIPNKYQPTESQGIRNNLAFESLTFTPNQRFLFTATEGALVQDGPTASLTQGSPVRVLKLNGKNGKPLQEYIYLTDPIIDAPTPEGAFATNGLVELLALNNRDFIAIERSFSVGAGNNIRLYLTTTVAATNVKNVKSIQTLKSLKTMTKYLLLDLGDLGITLDNIEGVTIGETLPSGEKSLILVSDNNFNPNGQFTQFLAFKIKPLMD